MDSGTLEHILALGKRLDVQILVHGYEEFAADEIRVRDVVEDWRRPYTRVRRFGTSRSERAAAGAVAPPPARPARRLTHTVGDPQRARRSDVVEQALGNVNHSLPRKVEAPTPPATSASTTR